MRLACDGIKWRLTSQPDHRWSRVPGCPQHKICTASRDTGPSLIHRRASEIPNPEPTVVRRRSSFGDARACPCGAISDRRPHSTRVARARTGLRLEFGQARFESGEIGDSDEVRDHGSQRREPYGLGSGVFAKREDLIDGPCDALDIRPIASSRTRWRIDSTSDRTSGSAAQRYAVRSLTPFCSAHSATGMPSATAMASIIFSLLVDSPVMGERLGGDSSPRLLCAPTLGSQPGARAGRHALEGYGNNGTLVAVVADVPRRNVGRCQWMSVFRRVLGSRGPRSSMNSSHGGRSKLRSPHPWSAHAYDWLTSVDSQRAQGRGSRLPPIGSLNFDPACAFRHERIVALRGPVFVRGGAGCATLELMSLFYALSCSRGNG